FEIAAIFGEVFFKIAGQRVGGALLIVDAFDQPCRIFAKTVQPIPSADDRFNQSIETEVAEQLRNAFIPGANLRTKRFHHGLAREVETALLVKNREARIDAEREAVLAKNQSAE